MHFVLYHSLSAATCVKLLNLFNSPSSEVQIFACSEGTSSRVAFQSRTPDIDSPRPWTRC